MPNTVRKMTLQRDRLHRGVQREHARGRPLVDVAIGLVHHHPSVGLHALAVKRRQQQLAVAHVLGPVEHEHAAISEQRREGAVEAARGHDLAVVLEHLADVVRVGEEDERREAHQVDREGVAEARRRLVEEGVGAAQPAQRDERSGELRAGGQRHGGRRVLAPPGRKGKKPYGLLFSSSSTRSSSSLARSATSLSLSFR
jgi:hypothetical protein